MLNDKRIKSCLSRFDSGTYSRLQFLRAVSHSVGAHTESLQPQDDNSSSSSEDEDEDSQAPVPAATTSGASESATATAATTSDDCCEVCLEAPHDGFALMLGSDWCRADMRGSVKRCPPLQYGAALSDLTISAPPSGHLARTYAISRLGPRAGDLNCGRRHVHCPLSATERFPSPRHEHGTVCQMK